MFVKGFYKVAATADIMPKNLQDLAGKPAMRIFGRPIRRFAKGGIKSLVPLADLRDGVK